MIVLICHQGLRSQLIRAAFGPGNTVLNHLKLNHTALQKPPPIPPARGGFSDLGAPGKIYEWGPICTHLPRSAMSFFFCWLLLQ